MDIDWYDSKKVEAFNKKRSMEWIKLYAKLKEARNSGDGESLSKAREALRKHEAKDKVFKKCAEEAGNCW